MNNCKVCDDDGLNCNVCGFNPDKPMTDTKDNQPEEITDVPGGKESVQKVLEAFIDTKDSGMPDIRFLNSDHREMIMTDAWNHSVRDNEDKYYSESYLQSRIAEAEERQRKRCANAYRKAKNRANEVHWENTEDTYNAILNAGGQDDE